MTEARPRSEPQVASPRHLGYVPALDGLRAVAVLLVVLSHLWIAAEGINGIPGLGWFARGGFLGVDIFFVLSGFLITSLLFGELKDSGRVRFGRFYMRRALRLLPALFVVLGAVSVYSHVNGYTNFGGSQWLHLTVRNALTYTSNLQVIDHPFTLGDLGQLWSLSIEEQFYIVWPLTLLLIVRFIRSPRAVVAMLASAIVAVAVTRLVVYRSDGWSAAYHGTTTRGDGLLMGALLGVAWIHRLTPTRHLARAAWAAVIVCTLIIAVGRGDAAFVYYGGFTLFNAAVALVILAVVESGWTAGPALAHPLMQLAGRVSYGLYLWQLPMIWVARRWSVDVPGIVRVALAVTLTVLAAGLSWVVVERPAQQWRRRWEQRRAALEGKLRARRTLEFRRYFGTAVSAVAVAAVPYLYILWNGRWDPLRKGVPEGFFSNFFELQARAMAVFRWDVPRGSLGIEGFVVDGREYTYFPPFPSLLRMPVLAFTERYDGRLTAPSILFAWLVTALFTVLFVWRIRTMVRPAKPFGRVEAAAIWLFLVSVLAGSSLVYIGAIPWVYHEPFAWGVAGSVGAFYAIAGVIERPTPARIWLAGAMTFVAVWSRTTMGWGCVAAAVIAAAWFAVGRRDRPRPGITTGVLLAGVIPLVAGAAVTYAKFGKPFMHPLTSQAWTTMNAQRRAALEANGGSLLGFQFLPSTLVTYLRPNGIRVTSLFPFITLPAKPPPVTGIGGALFDQTYRTASVTASMPLLAALTALGIGAVTVSRRPAIGIPILGAGLGCGGVLLYGYFGNRYVADFLPLLVVGGAVGLIAGIDWLEGRSIATRRFATGVVGLLTAFGVFANTAIAYATVRLQWGGTALANYVDIQRRTADLTGVPLSIWVDAGDELPVQGPADKIFVIGECDGLYVGTGESLEPWVPVELRGAEVTVTPTSEWTTTQRYWLVRLASIPEVYVGIEGDGTGRVRGLIDVAFLATFGDWFEPEVGKPITIEVIPNTRYHVIAVVVDGTTVGTVPTGNWDENGYRHQATPAVLMTTPPDTAPFEFADVTNSATPVCDRWRQHEDPG